MRETRFPNRDGIRNREPADYLESQLMAETATAPIGAEGRYWEALREGHLELPQCAGCGRWHWPAVFRCGECGSWQHDWKKQSLLGTVFSWNRTHHPFGGTESIEKPFTSVLVTLDAVPVRLIGILRPTGGNVAIGDHLEGQVATMKFRGRDLSAIRWSKSL